jgi:hypothetical protein
MRERTLKARIKREQERTLGIIANRTDRPGSVWWLSFVGDEGFRGAVMVNAEDFTTALMETNVRNINPHGEVQGLEIPADEAQQIPEHWKYRILSRDECEQFDKEMMSETPR